MSDSKAIYFGAIWTEGKEYPSGSMTVETLRELVDAAEEAGEEKIQFTVFENSEKEGKQPDLNLVFYPKETKKKYNKGFGSGGSGKKSPAKKNNRYGNTKKSSMFN